MEWHIALEPEPEINNWAVWTPELRGYASAERTEPKALENNREAIEFYLQSDLIQFSSEAISREIILD
ncbi:type II toxin-antitoxin system HicB family antitoxin [Leptolyngbya sp. FACHB-261]|uniref:type II toxin-antitoxin system HicB family antitoxin n=1 Tax=Leptolyngbya sp. FACHB-261 TaxID=2692806 RepID=UPI0016843DCC|nr:type II toxin-antitoxin system HicB family antitoxin [Leptolyngbya sp. FACHB-261]MBD2101497.1 type II toxin-antitoxin system HicB family antitoxin [Leptolyngbya sp. FACHB-261]